MPGPLSLFMRLSVLSPGALSVFQLIDAGEIHTMRTRTLCGPAALELIHTGTARNGNTGMECTNPAEFVLFV